MLETVKASFSRMTVKISLGAMVLCFISRYLPWLTDRSHSQSMVEAFAEKPSYFVGMPIMVIGGILLVAALFLLDRPKLTLIGDAVLTVVWLVFLMTASDYGLDLGIGAFLYLIAVIACVVMAFLTRRMKKAK